MAVILNSNLSILFLIVACIEIGSAQYPFLWNDIDYDHYYHQDPRDRRADQRSYLSMLEQRSLQNYLFENNFKSYDDVPDRIIGGENAAVDEAPFLAQLFRRFFYQNRFLCGGSLITPRTVLTAAHCVSLFYNYRVRYGSNSRLWSPFPDNEVKSMRPHPKFNLRTVSNDVALFILKNPMPPSANVQTIELETDSFDETTNATLYGFGLTKGTNKEPSNRLKKTTLKVLDNDECAEFISKLHIEKHPGMFCAAAPERSACNGDSGGPLINTENRKQIGIVSFGTRYCPPGSVNVYTNVTYYLDWIHKNKED
ncbi:surfeit 1 [Sarcoptes scabiei]|nr:surfeit 1 [Sarcoptes scabiei]